MKERSIVAMIVLTIITFGIYQLYWYIAFQVELKEETGEGFGGLGHFLVSILTLGIYSIYWQFAAGKRIKMMGGEDWSIIYLILVFVSLSWLNPFLMQHQANQL